MQAGVEDRVRRRPPSVLDDLRAETPLSPIQFAVSCIVPLLCALTCGLVSVCCTDCSTADARGVFDRLQQEGKSVFPTHPPASCSDELTRIGARSLAVDTGFIKLLPSKSQAKKGAKKSAKKDHFVVDRSKEDEAELYFGADGQKREDALFKVGGAGEDQEMEGQRSWESSM